METKISPFNLYVSKNGFYLSGSAFEAMNKPEFVLFKIYKENCLVGIFPHPNKEYYCVSFHETKGIYTFSSKKLLDKFVELLKFDPSNEAIRIDGKLVEDENILLFDLKKYEIVHKRRRI